MPTTRETLAGLVEASAEFTEKSAWDIWQALYTNFEFAAGIPYRLEAKNSNQTPLDYIEECQHLENLLSFATGYLTQKPGKEG